MYFKHAIVTSAEVERAFSQQNTVTPQHLQGLCPWDTHKCSKSANICCLQKKMHTWGCTQNTPYWQVTVDKRRRLEWHANGTVWNSSPMVPFETVHQHCYLKRHANSAVWNGLPTVPFKTNPQLCCLKRHTNSVIWNSASTTLSNRPTMAPFKTTHQRYHLKWLANSIVYNCAPML